MDIRLLLHVCLNLCERLDFAQPGSAERNEENLTKEARGVTPTQDFNLDTS